MNAKNRSTRRARQRKQRVKVSSTGSNKTQPTDYTIERRIEKLEECIRLYPREIAKDLAKREEAGWYFGRLYLIGAITWSQKIAADRLFRAVKRYQYLLNRYSGVKSMLDGFDYVKGKGGISPENFSEEADERMKKAHKDQFRLLAALKSSGPAAERAVLDAMEKDQATDLELIRKGLEAIRMAL